MKITIDTEVLEREKICANGYVLMYSIFSNQNARLEYSDKMLDDLESKGFIKQTEDGVVLRGKALALFGANNDLELSFLEFFNSFPIKVPSDNGGSRPLRPKSSEAESAKDIRKKYLAIIKDRPELHKHILKVLDAELDMRRKSNSMKFMNGIVVWLNQRLFEKYEYLLDDLESNKELKEDRL